MTVDVDSHGDSDDDDDDDVGAYDGYDDHETVATYGITVNALAINDNQIQIKGIPGSTDPIEYRVCMIHNVICRSLGEADLTFDFYVVPRPNPTPDAVRVVIERNDMGGNISRWSTACDVGKTIKRPALPGGGAGASFAAVAARRRSAAVPCTSPASAPS